MRSGNQAVGKTHAGCAEDIFRLRGEHPFIPVPSAPVRGAVVTGSWKQSLVVQSRLWSMVPKDEVHPACRFDEVIGFRGKNPTLRMKNGSSLDIRTTQQGGLSLAGGTYDFVHFDEPPRSPRVFEEMRKRTVKTNGVVYLTYTPVNAPVGYLREMVEAGSIEDIWAPLTAEAMIPVGSSRPVRLPDGTVCDATWIQSLIADTMPFQVPVVIHGEWEMRSEGQLFRGFRDSGPRSHVSERVPNTFELQVGIDYGSGAHFSACAVLVAVAKVKGEDHIYVLDEYVSDGETTIEQDARGIRAMLTRWSQQWRSLTKAYGDRPWRTRGSRALQVKDNRAMAKALGKMLPGQTPETLSPPIATVKRGKGHGAGSIHVGCAYLHRAMVGDRFHVQPRCKRVIESLNKWDWRDNQYKHIIDCLRYSIDNRIFGTVHVNAKRPTYYMY